MSLERPNGFSVDVKDYISDSEGTLYSKINGYDSKWLIRFSKCFCKILIDFSKCHY